MLPSRYTQAVMAGESKFSLLKNPSNQIDLVAILIIFLYVLTL